MKKVLNLTTLFLSCRLVWQWFQRCGSPLGMGESLPFCLECVPMATILRLIFLGIVIWYIAKLLQEEVAEALIIEKDKTSVQILRIHWHRIFVLLALISYSIWIDWIDINTSIPGPDDIPVFKESCDNDSIKGTFLWGINMLFIAFGFRILHKTEENKPKKEISHE